MLRFVCSEAGQHRTVAELPHRPPARTQHGHKPLLPGPGTPNLRSSKSEPPRPGQSAPEEVCELDEPSVISGRALSQSISKLHGPLLTAQTWTLLLSAMRRDVSGSYLLAAGRALAPSLREGGKRRPLRANAAVSSF